MWGGELARGAKPEPGGAVGADAAPARHAARRRAGAARARRPATSPTLLVLGSLAAVVWLALALGRAWFGGAAGWIAAALALTSVPLLTHRGAGVPRRSLPRARARRRCWSRRGAARAGAPVLALLAVAGLWRPEAWLFSAAYWVWSARGRPRARGGAARRARGRGAAGVAPRRPRRWPATRCIRSRGPASRPPRSGAPAGRARSKPSLPDKLAHAAGLPVLDRRDRGPRRSCCAGVRAMAAGWPRPRSAPRSRRPARSRRPGCPWSSATCCCRWCC